MKFLRLRIFHEFLWPFSQRMRAKRMRLFEELMKLRPGMKILDLGGQPDIWDRIETPLNITCLNLPGIAKQKHQSHHKITYIEGNACDMPYYSKGDFDLVFSNSVIEHVGDSSKRLEFANEVTRLSNKYWVQTPSKIFPIEAHCGMPFWWFYPQVLRSFFLNRWEKNLPGWTKMVATTSVVSTKEIREILPDCKIRYEWFLFLPKSIVAYSTGE